MISLATGLFSAREPVATYAISCQGTYLRLRRYVPLPEERGFGPPIMAYGELGEYGQNDFFLPGVDYAVTIIKRDQELFMRVTEKESGR